MIKVAVTDWPFDSLDIEAGILEPLGCGLVVRQAVPPPDELAALVADADHVLTGFAPLTAAIIAGMARARVIVRYGVGVDNVDLDAARSRGIPVCNVPDYCIDEVADHTLALLLALTRRVVVGTDAIRAGGWGLVGSVASLTTLKHATVGVVGCGRIGREVVRRLLAFKCRVLVNDPALSDGEVRGLGAEPAGFHDLLAASDIITLHCPAHDGTPTLPRTKGMLNRDAFARMKPGAILVNTGRGTLVDSAALVEALTQGRLAAAGLDVFDPEPMPADSPVRKMDNVVLTSHVAAVSAASMRRLRESAAGTVARAVRGEPLPNVVNGITR